MAEQDLGNRLHGDPCLVIPVHNRKNITIRCLENLRQMGIFEWARIIVVDDGSTDGTADCIREGYSDVQIVEGDGKLYWTGGIKKGMRYAIWRKAKVIFWLNDDCFPLKGTLELLMENSLKHHCISVAQSTTPTGYVYGGYKRTRYGLDQITCKPGEYKECDCFSGNCVCLLSDFVTRIGYPNSREFPHHYGDHEYGLRASKAGIVCIIAGDAGCKNEDSLGIERKSWLLGEYKTIDFLRTLFTVKSPLYLPIALKYKTRYWGIHGCFSLFLTYFKLVLTCFVRAFFPRNILIKSFSSRSKAWTIESYYGKRKETSS